MTDSTSVRNWKYRSEADLVSAALGELDRYFTTVREVRGVHGTGKRLDAVLRPRDPSGWFDPAPAFGVEFKNALAASLDTRARPRPRRGARRRGRGVLR